MVCATHNWYTGYVAAQLRSFVTQKYLSQNVLALSYHARKYILAVTTVVYIFRVVKHVSTHPEHQNASSVVTVVASEVEGGKSD